MFKGLLPAILYLASTASSADQLAFEKPRTFAGKIEGNWEYGRFRECGTLKHCSQVLSTCGYNVSNAAKASWDQLLPDERDRSYWVEFVGRKKALSPAEMANNLDPKVCVVEVLGVIAACESSSPIYPDESGKVPECASPASRR